MEGGEKKQWSDLPTELVSLLFSFIETKEVLSTCIYLSKGCKEAVMSEIAWKERCQRDLEVLSPLDSLSWYETYKGKPPKRYHPEVLLFVKRNTNLSDLHNTTSHFTHPKYKYKLNNQKNRALSGTFAPLLCQLTKGKN